MSHGPSKWTFEHKPASGTPARGRRPPFHEGNQVALRHGAFSPRVYQPVARELFEGLVAHRPDLAGYTFEVVAWAESEARAMILREHVESRGMFDAEGEPRDGVLKWLSKFEAEAREGRKRLGLDPRSDAELARQRAEAGRSQVDLDAVRQRGREVLQVGDTDDGDGPEDAA